MMQPTSPGVARPPPSRRFASPALWLAVTSLVLAFAFLGQRGIWDPDEGRYTNVALTMLDSGNWLDPMRNEDTGHWTKPPLTYWLVATSVATFGQTPWAARLPIALSYLACILLVGLSARRLLDDGGHSSALIYATMLLPFGAAQLITTDYLLAACQSLAMYGFILHRFGGARRPTTPRGLLLMWAGFALGFMTKGPPALATLLPLALFAVLAPSPRRTPWRWHAAGVALFAVLAMPWYVAVVMRHEGLLAYFFGAEVVDRLATDRFGRNGQWYGWLAVYAPTLLLGTLPWTLALLRWTRTIPSVLKHAWVQRRTLSEAEARTLFVVLWILVPLLVFCLARSRLPLYLLPLFTPLAIAVAGERRRRGSLFVPRQLAVWVLALLAVKWAAGDFPSHKDASTWAQAIAERAQGPITEVVFVDDMARYGLHLHLDAEIERVSSRDKPQARFNPSYDESLRDEISETGRENGVVYVTKQAQWPHIAGYIRDHGYAVQPLGEPYRDRVIFEVMLTPRTDAATPNIDPATDSSR